MTLCQNKDGNYDREKDIELVILKSINNNYEYNLTKALLEDNDILFITNDYGSGGYLRTIGGFSLFSKPAEILVEKSMFDRAKAILDKAFSEID